MTAWSYSALGAFETCPRRYFLTKITKEVHEPQTEATLHGNAVHRALERAIKGEEMLPAKFARYQPIVQRCQRAPGEKLVEMKWAITNSFKPTAYFAPDVWCRGVVDFGVVREDRAAVVDWKTGKPRHDIDQLKLFAAAIFVVFPTVVRVSTGFAWLAGGAKMDTQTYTREQIPDLWDVFLPRVARLESAVRRGDFPPRPSGLCKAHCPVTRSKCEFSGTM